MTGRDKTKDHNFVAEIIQRSAKYWYEKGFTLTPHKTPLDEMTNMELENYVADLEARLQDAETMIKDIFKHGAATLKKGPGCRK